MATPRWFSRWDFAALAGLAALVCIYGALLHRLPDPMQIHFDVAGRANGWAPKAQLPWVVLGAPVFLWLVLFLIGGVATLLPAPPGRRRPVAIGPLRGLLGLGMCLVMAGCLLVPRYGRSALFAGLLALGLCMAIGIVLLVRDIWQALAGLPPSGHYRCGVFYVNPDDPRLWVEKRFGIGWTLNYARPAALWLTLLMAAAIPALVLAVRGAIR